MGDLNWVRAIRIGELAFRLPIFLSAIFALKPNFDHILVRICNDRKFSPQSLFTTAKAN